MNRQIIEIQRLTDLVDGFQNQNGKNLREGEVLYHLARVCRKNGKIAEIGSWKGKSTIWLGKGAQSSQSRVYAIDHHVGSPEHQKKSEVWTFDTFKENIARADLNDTVTPILKKSQDAIDDIQEKLDILFIDGAHEYEGAKADFDLYLPKMKAGGTIAFHDSFGFGWPGVRRLVHEEVFKSSKFSKVRYINAITYAVVTDKATFREKIANRFALFVKKLHEHERKIPQPFRSIVKKLTWEPCNRRWLQELEDS